MVFRSTILMSLAACAQPLSKTSKTVSASPITVEEASPARDGNIAISEEFLAAKQKNTTEAYELFIARHPNHILAKEAKTLRDAVKSMLK